MAARINLILIDKNMNTFEVDIPTFMLQEINFDPMQVKKHETKKDLTAEINNFLKKHNQKLSDNS